MDPVTIYIANLSHVDSEGHPATDSIPINIGYLGAYVREKLGPSVHVELFNLPSKLEDAFGRKIPNILACSNYVWSSNLNYHYISHYKELHPEMVTVMGGPNYPGIKEKQIEFLKGHEALDFYVYEEGDITFLELVRSLAENGFDANALKAGVIKGCHYMADNDFVDGGPGERLQDLNTLPSPYTAGLFDEMLRDGFVPIIQTNRGCPFSCAYCHSSMKYYSKLYKFDLKHIDKEIEYIAKNSIKKYLYITDDNFGFFDQDLHISKTLSRCKDKYDWPLQACIATSKTRKENVFKCVSQLGDTVYFTVSMQSMNEDTLKAIKRKNLSFEEQKDIMNKLKTKNVKSSCELILGLPLETKESHMAAIKAALDAGVEILGLYTCMLLKNTPLSEDPSYAKYGMLRKHRVIPYTTGIYTNGNILEIEEVCVATSALSFEDYVYLRGFHFIVSSFYNFGALEEIIAYLKNTGISIFDWLSRLHEAVEHDNGKAGDIYSRFIHDTKSELWDSEEEILRHYSSGNNFQKVLDGIEGANLLQKYGAIFLDNLSSFIALAVDVIKNSYDHADNIVMDNLLRFSLGKRGNVFDTDLVHTDQSFDFDVLKWAQSGMTDDIKCFDSKTTLSFSLNEKQRTILQEYLDFYGSKEASRARILSRTNYTALYRECSYS